MRPPWDRSAQDLAELEALQTDVMRFIAILGLCLAAIFSLVNGAEREERTAPPPASEPLTREPALEAPDPALSRTVSAAVAEPLQEVREQPQSTLKPQPADPETTSIGFTLEFESEDVMHALQAAGRIQLLATGGGRCWQYLPGGGFKQIKAPPSYYRMHPETVPGQLRRLAAGLDAGETIEWGVTLPEATSLSIRRLMAGRQGGSLVIGPDAEVGLERGVP